MKNWCVIFLAAMVGGGLTARAQPVNAISAVVHDSVITLQEIEAPTLPLIQELRRKYAGQPELFEKERAKILNEQLDQRVERELVLHEFSASGFVLPETYAEEEVRRRLQSDFGGDRARMIKTLQAEGITLEKYRQRLRENLMYRLLVERNVGRELTVSPHRIETYYLAHKDEYKADEQIHLRMIALGTKSAEDTDRARKIAGEIVTKIKGGTAFTEMADTYSSGGFPGGDRGWVQKFSPSGALVLRKELADVAFSLKPGELSDIIETPEALYLLLVEDKKPAQTKALNEVREEIERAMLTQEQERVQKQWIERLKKKTFVRYF